MQEREDKKCNFLFLICRAAWARIFCTNYLESLQCQQFVMNCKDSIKRAELETDNTAAAMVKILSFKAKFIKKKSFELAFSCMNSSAEFMKKCNFVA